MFVITPAYAQTILDDVLVTERDKFFLSLITLVGAEEVMAQLGTAVIFAPADDYFLSLGRDQQLALFGPAPSDAARELLRNHLFAEDLSPAAEAPVSGRLLRLIAAPERTLRFDADAGQAGRALVLGEPITRDQITWVTIDRPLAASDLAPGAQATSQEFPTETLISVAPLAPDAERQEVEVVEVVTAANRNLLQLLEREPSLSRFTALLRETGMDAGVESYPRYTLFAPTNAAFDGVNISGQSRKALVNTLARHIVEGKLQRDDLVQAKRVIAINGSVLSVEANSAGAQKPAVQSVPLLSRTLVARNGVIHPIEQLLPVE